MKESAQAALSYVRGHADLPDDWFATHDLHIHVPAGAIPKDGPSAGITMATALMSLVTGRPVRDDTAMTGELTLTGQVLPIGGLKEKALAAQRAGVRRVLAPSRNEPDIEDIPDALRKNLEFVWVDEIGDVFDAALVNGRPGYARPRRRDLESELSEARWRSKKVQKAGKTAQAARSNPYVQRLIEDDDLRQNIVQAYESARDAYWAAEQRQEPDQADLRRQEAAEACEGSRGQRPRRRAWRCTRRRRSRRAAAASVASCCSASSAAPWRSRSPRAAQEGARRAVRRRGGVRVHLDHLVAVARGHRRLTAPAQ